MLNEFERLKSELSVLYPDVTDIELTEMTDNLINFYKIAVEAVLEQENKLSLTSQTLKTTCFP